jgi:membrane-associated phospholipid phosphatase
LTDKRDGSQEFGDGSRPQLKCMYSFVRIGFVVVISLCCLRHPSMAQSSAGYKWLLQLQQKRTSGKTHFYTTVSDLSSSVSIAVPAGLVITGLLAKDKNMLRTGLYAGGSLAANGLLTTILKKTIRRQRPFVTYPDIIPLDEVSTWSFPSGHTSHVFAMATSVSISYPKWYVIVPAFAAAGLAGYSRLYLGVHYPGDVVAGAVTGAGSAFLTHQLLHWMEKRYRRKKQPLLSLCMPN